MNKKVAYAFLLLLFLSIAFWGAFQYTDILLGSLGILFICLLIVKKIILYRKSRQSLIFIEALASQDPCWDSLTMQEQGKVLFTKIMEAIALRNISGIKELVTTTQQGILSTEIDELLRKGEQVVATKIKFGTVKVIGCESYKNKANDSFCLYISGNYRRGYIATQKPRLTHSFKYFFTAIYYFKRAENSWLLDKVDSRDELRTLLSMRNYKE